MRDDGRPRFNQLLLFGPRKFGKSTLFSALCAFDLLTTPRAEVLTVSSTVKQSAAIFETVANFNQDPTIAKRLHIRQHVNEIRDKRGKGKLTILSSNAVQGLSGANTTGIYLDEVCEWRAGISQSETFDVKVLIEDAINIIQGMVPVIVDVFEYLASWKPQIQFAIAVVKNLGAIWELTYTQMALIGVSTLNQVVFFFTDILPAAINYVADNGFDIMKNMFKNILNFAKNYLDTLVTVWSQVPDLIMGNVTVGDLFNDAIREMSKDFVPIITEEFKIPERKVEGIEQILADDVDRLAGNLTKNLTQTFERQQKRSQEIADKASEVITKAGSTGTPEVKVKQEKLEFASAAELGSQDARNIILKNLGVGKGDEDLDIQKQQLATQKEQLRLARQGSSSTVREVAIVG